MYYTDDGDVDDDLADTNAHAHSIQSITITKKSIANKSKNKVLNKKIESSEAEVYFIFFFLNK